MEQPAAQEVAISNLPADLVTEAVGVLARGMRDNPNNVAAFGDDPERRQRSLRRMFAALFHVMSSQQPICARHGETVVAVTGVAPPGGCQPTAAQRLRMAPSILAAGPRRAARVLDWVGAWAQQDPREPHVHLGPLAVEPRLQGRGIGSLILTEHCRRLEQHGAVGYLETDKPENVALYERFGYRVVAESAVIGVPNWFMRRDPARR